jgi:hypothetical protein
LWLGLLPIFLSFSEKAKLISKFEIIETIVTNSYLYNLLVEIIMSRNAKKTGELTYGKKLETGNLDADFSDLFAGSTIGASVTAKATLKPIKEINPSPIEIALSYLARTLGENGIKSFLTYFDSVDQLRLVLTTEVAYLRHVEDFSYRLDRVMALAAHPAHAVEDLVINYQREHVDITPYNWHENVISSGPVKLKVDNGYSKMYSVGLSVLTLDYTSLEKAWKSLDELFGLCSAMSRSMEYTVKPCSDWLMALTQLLAYHCKIQIDEHGLTLTGIERIELPPGATTAVTKVILFGTELAKAIIPVLAGKLQNHYRDENKPLAVLYSNLCDVLHLIDKYEPEVRKLRTMQERLNLTEVYVTPQSVVDMIKKDNRESDDSDYTVAKRILVDSTDFLLTCSQLNVATMDEMCEYKLFPLTKGKWGLLHRVQVLHYALGSLSRDHRPQYLIFHGAGADKLALSMDLGLAQNYYGFIPGDFKLMYNMPGIPRYMEGVTFDKEQQNTDKKERVFIGQSYQDANWKRDGNATFFVCQMPDGDTDYELKLAEYLARRPTVLVVPHNLCSLQKYVNILQMIKDAGYRAEVHRHPRRQNEFYYWIITKVPDSLATEENSLVWTDKCFGYRAALARECIENNVRRNAAITCGWMFDHTKQNTAFQHAVGVVIATVHRHKELSAKVRDRQVKDPAILAQMIRVGEKPSPKPPGKGGSDNNNDPAPPGPDSTILTIEGPPGGVELGATALIPTTILTLTTGTVPTNPPNDPEKDRHMAEATRKRSHARNKSKDT